MDNDTFNPDELKLSKDQIIKLIQIIQNRWRKNRLKNAHYLIGIAGFKAGIRLTPDETLEKVWSDLVSLTNEMINYNQMQRMKDELPDTENMIKIFEQKIENGEILNG